MRQDVKQTESREADALVFAPLQFNQGPESLSKAVDVARLHAFHFHELLFIISLYVHPPPPVAFRARRRRP